MKIPFIHRGDKVLSWEENEGRNSLTFPDEGRPIASNPGTAYETELLPIIPSRTTKLRVTYDNGQEVGYRQEAVA